jgi:hypothetical protein
VVEDDDDDAFDDDDDYMEVDDEEDEQAYLAKVLKEKQEHQQILAMQLGQAQVHMPEQQGVLRRATVPRAPLHHSSLHTRV